MRHDFAVIEPVEGAEHVAHRIAQLAIGIDAGLEDFVGDAQIVGIILARSPQAQDLDAVFLGDIFRRDDIAQGFGHFAAIARHHETMGEHGVIRRAAPRSAALEQG